MELQFHKSVFGCMCPVLRETQKQELTQEVRLSDGMPDIGKVIGAWGQCLVRGKEWRSTNVAASGGVMAWVLYMPEDGSEPRIVEIWMPYQMKWEIPEGDRDGGICIIPMLLGVDARSVSARKLMVRSSICVTAEAYVPMEAELYEPAELPEDLCVLRTKYPVTVPREIGEKAFAVEESIQLPADAQQLEKLLRYALRPELTELKVMADKLIFRGEGVLELLYRSTNGHLAVWEHKIPFAQYVDLDREYDSTATARVCFAVTNLELDRAEEDALALKAGLIAQYIIFQRPNIEVIEDTYSTRRAVQPITAELNLPTVLEENNEIIRCEVTADTELSQILDAVFYPEAPRFYTEEDRVTAELAGSYQILGYDADGQLRTETCRWEDSWAIPAEQGCRLHMQVQPTDRPHIAVGGSGAMAATEMALHWQVMAGQGISMTTGLELGEQKEPNPERPSLILRRAGTDRLWDMAKAAGTTVEAIRQINALQQEPDSEQILLISVP